VVDEAPPAAAPEGDELLRFYDRTVALVHGYLLRRCGSVAVAEDLTAETFLAAVDSVRRDVAPPLNEAWILGVARHKLVDHWRRQAREERRLEAVRGSATELDDPWDTTLERTRAREVLDQLGAHHRAALVLRYLDGRPVPEIAVHLDRTVHATEALLVRARRAFRAAYTAGEEGRHA
jgi:RNA polymerase sigma-70 factor (ECF subfamily)